jgi:1-pyrroline-5-carboxylate dehydrogenase
VLSWNNQQIKSHVDAVLAVPDAELLFGGSELTDHDIPDCFGAYEPTAIRVPLSELCGGHFELLTTELFGPFQIVASYGDADIESLLSLFERMSNHLTAAVVSEDVRFQNRVLAATVNGTTYCGLRARTTGAPQNHWFGPSGDPRGAGIGTREAIVTTWSAHREIIFDEGALPEGWSTPPSR